MFLRSILGLGDDVAHVFVLRFGLTDFVKSERSYADGGRDTLRRYSLKRQHSTKV